MEHEVIPPGEIHAPHNWVVADEASRLALVVTEADRGKYCWQRDNESQWFLSAHDPATWQPMATTVAWGDIADKPDLIEEGDIRLTDSRTPTGGAGGVLSGSFPNPGFAVDMATQGEVDTQVTLLYTALDDLGAAKIDATEKGAANGVATLGADSKIPESQLPSVAITDVFAVADQAAMLALTAERGDIAVRSDLNKTFALAALPASTLANWLELRTPTDAVLSVAGRTGAITLAKADVGLGNVDNTSDADKPVSTAQAAALTAHTGQSTGAHAASAVSNTPAGNIAATTVQAAINELDSEKVGKTGAQSMTGVLTAGGLLSNAGGIGYGAGAGAGGTVTQTTSKGAGVVLHKLCGQIIMSNSELGAGVSVAFVMTNATIGAIDTVFVGVSYSGGLGDKYQVWASPTDSAVVIYVKNITAGSLSESLTINFAIIKSAIS